MANATIAASIAAGIGQIITDTGTANNVTYAGNTYTAGVGVLSTERQYEAVGELDGYALTLTILQSALDANGDAPEAGEEITTPDGVKRILRVRKDSAFGTCQRIDTGDRY